MAQTVPISCSHCITGGSDGTDCINLSAVRRRGYRSNYLHGHVGHICACARAPVHHVTNTNRVYDPARAAATTGVAPAHTLVVLEATSTYWIQLAVTLHQAGYVLSVVNPQQVHHYAKSSVRRGKTDALNAQLLAQFALERCPEPWTPPPGVYHELRQRLSARALLLSTRQQVRNHRHALVQWPVVVAVVQEQLEQVIVQLDAQIVALDTAIAQVLENGEWAESTLLLQSITGAGTLTSAWLLVTTLNFTLGSTPNALSAYAGLAPLPHDSGSSIHSRRRIGHAGNR